MDKKTKLKQIEILLRQNYVVYPHECAELLRDASTLQEIQLDAVLTNLRRSKAREMRILSESIYNNPKLAGILEQLVRHQFQQLQLVEEEKEKGEAENIIHEL